MGLASSRDRRQIRFMLGLSPGEIGLVGFMVVAILSAKFWPRAGEWVTKRFGREADGEH